MSREAHPHTSPRSARTSAGVDGAPGAGAPSAPAERSSGRSHPLPRRVAAPGQRGATRKTRPAEGGIRRVRGDPRRRAGAPGWGPRERSHWRSRGRTSCRPPPRAPRDRSVRARAARPHRRAVHPRGLAHAITSGVTHRARASCCVITRGQLTCRRYLPQGGRAGRHVSHRARACRVFTPPRGPPTWLGSCHHVRRDAPRARYLCVT
jgi:hypothetical protein